MHIAQFGTFDIESYGDCLFPRMLQYSLERYLNCELTLFSMTSKEESYYSWNGHIYAVDEFDERNAQTPFSAVIIGGGELLHYSPIEVFTDQGTIVWEDGAVWKKPVQLAERAGIQCFINCIGVPYNFTERQRQDLSERLRGVRKISVRECFSWARMQGLGLDNLYPDLADNLWYLNRIFSVQELRERRKNLLRRLELNEGRDYFVVQYGTTKEIPQLAEQLRGIAERSGLCPVILPINYCHEDIRAAELLCAQLQGLEKRYASFKMQPPEIMALIAGASLFIGTSLHGNLTAISYGVRAIGIDMYPENAGKMDGLFTELESEWCLCPRAAALRGTFERLWEDGGIADRRRQRVRQLQERLDHYYEELSALIAGR